MAKTAQEIKKRVLTVVIASNKGGVGKTTTAIQLGTGLGVAGKNLGAVILIDGDAQGHVGEYLGIGSTGDFAAALLGEKPLLECLTPMEQFNHLWVMRGDESTWELDRTFVKREGEKDAPPLAERLREMLDALAGLAEGDKKVLAIIDTAPSYSEIQTAALIVADYILCPLTPSIGGEMGMTSMWEWARQLGNSKGFGVLPQMYDLENAVHKRTLRTIQHMVGKRIYPAIPYSPEIAEAIDASIPIWLSRKLSGSQVGARYSQVLEKLAHELGIELELRRED